MIINKVKNINRVMIFVAVVLTILVLPVMIGIKNVNKVYILISAALFELLIVLILIKSVITGEFVIKGFLCDRANKPFWYYLFFALYSIIAALVIYLSIKDVAGV